MIDDADVAQARNLLSALQEQIDSITKQLEKAEMRRRRGAPANHSDSALRRDLYEAYRHIERLQSRYPEIKTNPA